MRATVLNCSLKGSDKKSNTQALADVVIDKLTADGVEVRQFRLADLNLAHGVKTDMGQTGTGARDEWPTVHEELLAARILIIATPTWVAHPSSLAQQALERMDAMITETDGDGRPVAYNKVAGVVVTGNEDGAHHVISEVSGGLADIGYTIPGQAWTYWNMGPGPGPSYTDSDHKHDWSKSTGEAMAANLLAVAKALEAMPIPVPPNA